MTGKSWEERASELEISLINQGYVDLRLVVSNERPQSALTGADFASALAKGACQICGGDGNGPLLRDEVWNLISPDRRGMMCLGCMQARAAAILQRTLTKADLTTGSAAHPKWRDL
jgi:hypothetical protein